MSLQPSIAILGPPPTDRGGIAQQTRLLAEHLGEFLAEYFSYSRRYPRWLDPRRFDKLPAADSARISNTPIFDYAFPLSWTRTARAIAESGASALLVPWWTSFWAVPLAGLFSRLETAGPGVRRVVLCHNVVEHETSRFRESLSHRALARANAFVVHSPEDAARIRELAPGAPQICLPHAVEERPRPDREASRRQLRIDRPLVLFLGLVRRYKGVETLVDAAPRISAAGARVAIVGEVFRDSRNIRERIASSPARDAILLVDRYVDETEMDAWLSASDVVVCPYRSISGSGIAARALAAGRPVVASDLPGFRLLLSDMTGAFVVPGDPEDLARGVLGVIGRGLDFFVPALDEAVRRCSWPSYVSALLRFLDFSSDAVFAGPDRDRARIARLEVRMKTRMLAILLVLSGSAILYAGGLSKKYKEWTKNPESYFMTTDEKAAWKNLKTDDEAEKFIAEYKAKRGDEFFKSLEPGIAAADKYFSSGKVKGSETLRGKVIIVFGPPSALDQSKGGGGGPGYSVNGGSGGGDRSSGGGGVSLSSAGGGGSALSGSLPDPKLPTFSFIYDDQAAPKVIGKGFRVDLNMVSNAEQEPADPKDLEQKFEAVAEASIQKPKS